MDTTLEWLTWDEAYIKETKDREEIDPTNLCTYGVK